jgi:hypothetical protein
MPLTLLLVFLVAASVIGIGAGYMIWSAGASNYAVISKAKEELRTSRIHDISVTYPTVIIAKAGQENSITIGLTNLDDDPEYVAVSLALASNNGIDTSTISTLTNVYTVTLASYGTVNHTLNMNPSTTGYAFFDLIVKGKLVGTVTLYVVPS